MAFPMKASLVFLFCVLAPVALFAQANNNAATPAPQPAIVPMWRCQLPGGTYEVVLRSIVSVSTHEYLVDGAVRVTECNIDTAGNTLARFYYIEPNAPAPATPGGLGAATVDKAQQLLNQASTATGVDVWKKVVKSYPTTTHAHTVEYRLTSKEQVQQIFQSVENSFRTGKAGNFTASE
jgi:hypothetical protein